MMPEPCILESASAGQPHLKEPIHLGVGKGKVHSFAALSQLTRSGLAAANVLPIMLFVAPDFCTEKHQCFQPGDFRAKFLIFAPHGIVNDAVASGYHLGRAVWLAPGAAACRAEPGTIFTNVSLTGCHAEQPNSSVD